MSGNEHKRQSQRKEEHARHNRAIADKSTKLSARSRRPGLEQERRADRRTARTEKRLREALHSLIQEKDYDLIVVKEILDRADVGRSAFYMHFRNKDDLLISTIRGILAPVPRIPAGQDGREKILWFSLPILEHLEHQRKAGGLRLDGRGRNILHGHLQRVLADLIANECRRDLPHMQSAASAVPVSVLVQHLAATFILVLNWWIESGSPLSARQANALYRSLVLPALAETSRGNQR